MEVVTFPKLGLSFNISRVAFTIGNFKIYWYGLLIGAGLLLAMLYALKQSKEFGLDQNKFMDAIIWGVLAGVVGARLYYIAFSPRDDFSTIKSMLDIRNGGMGFYGAVIGGVLAVWIVSRVEKIKLLPMLDLTGIGFLIGQGIGRWGNFMNQEAFGTNTELPWGMYSAATQRYISMHSEEIIAHGMHAYQFSPVHPTFLYESLWCILGFIILAVYAKHRKFDGEVFLMYLVWNGSLRMFLEGIRLDSLYIGNIRVSQLLAVIMAFGALALIVVIRNRIKIADDPEFMKPYGHTAAWEEEYRKIVEKEENAKNNRRSAKKVIEEDARSTKEEAELAEAVNAAEEKVEPELIEAEPAEEEPKPEEPAAEEKQDTETPAAETAETTEAPAEAPAEEKPKTTRKRSSGSSSGTKKKSGSTGKKSSGGSKKTKSTAAKAAAAVTEEAEPKAKEIPAEAVKAEEIPAEPEKAEEPAVSAEPEPAAEPKKEAPAKKSTSRKSSGTKSSSRSSSSKSSSSKSSSSKSSSAKSSSSKSGSTKSSSGRSRKSSSAKKTAEEAVETAVEAVVEQAVEQVVETVEETTE